MAGNNDINTFICVKFTYCVNGETKHISRVYAKNSVTDLEIEYPSEICFANASNVHLTLDRASYSNKHYYVSLNEGGETHRNFGFLAKSETGLSFGTIKLTPERSLTKMTLTFVAV